MSARVDIVLFLFGIGSIVGLWVVGAMVDRLLQFLAAASILVFALAAVLFGLGGKISQIVYPTVVVWGLAFGGLATITQTALSRLAGDSMDVAQSMYTTVWNTAVASGGILGGVLLDQAGVGSFTWVMLAILVGSFGAVLAMNRAISRQNHSS